MRLLVLLPGLITLIAGAALSIRSSIEAWRLYQNRIDTWSEMIALAWAIGATGLGACVAVTALNSLAA